MINKDGAAFYLNGQHVVQAGVWRKRSLIHCRSDSLTRRRAIVQTRWRLKMVLKLGAYLHSYEQR